MLTEFLPQHSPSPKASEPCLEQAWIQSLRAPKPEEGAGVADLAPSDRFFTYKHFLDGNGELIDPVIMMIIGRAMIRNKPDSYCQSWDVRTQGVTAMVRDLIALYRHYGMDPALRASAAYAPADGAIVPTPKPSLIKRLFR